MKLNLTDADLEKLVLAVRESRKNRHRGFAPTPITRQKLPTSARWLRGEKCPGQTAVCSKKAPVYFYKFYAEDGSPIYVGITKNPRKRFLEHKEKAWYANAAFYELLGFETRVEARAWERWFIRVFSPPKNRRG